jgi:hypothetical protein
MGRFGFARDYSPFRFVKVEVFSLRQAQIAGAQENQL